MGFLASPELHNVQALVVVVLTRGLPPQRRNEEAFLTLLGPSVPVPEAAINAAAAQLEAALGRTLYPFTIQAADFEAHLSGQQLTAGAMRPYAIYDASHGTILIDRSLLQSSLGQEGVQHMVHLLGDKLFSQLASALPTMAEAGATASWQLVIQLLAQALALAVPLAFAAAPPLWFCILCPAVLGLVAPLVINFGLGELAGEVCTHLQLTDEQCFDLMLGALGLGFVLSLAAAIPIFFVCRLMECAHRNSSLAFFR